MSKYTKFYSMTKYAKIIAILTKKALTVAAKQTLQ